MKTSFLAALFLAISSICSQAAYVGIHAAAAQGDLDKLEKYLADDSQLISSRNGANRTPLTIAAMCGQTETVKFLIAQGADVNDRGFMKMSPLADMASPWGLRNDKKCVEIAKILLEGGAQIDANNNDYGSTALFWATQSGHKQLVQLLLEKKANAAISGKSGSSPLHVAAMTGKKEIVEILLKFKAPINARDRSGLTPLSLAKTSTHSPEVIEILEAAGATR